MAIGDPNRVVADGMDVLSDRILQRKEAAYLIALEAGQYFIPVFETADHAGAAYVLWASISDLQDDPRGPMSDRLCQQAAELASSEWHALGRDHRSIESYFERWAPVSGEAWRSVLKN